MICSICDIAKIDEFGINSHNAEPVNSGRCCDTCNLMYVIPTRMKQQFESECG